jgi:hypothetical protein
MSSSKPLQGSLEQRATAAIGESARNADRAGPPSSPGKRFISDVEIEGIYGIPRKTLQNWRVLGRGPIYRKFGDAVRYDVILLEAWIESLPSGGAGIPASAVKGND